MNRSNKTEPCYWLTSLKANDIQTVEEVIQILIGRERIWAFKETVGKFLTLKQDDWICFYAKGRGIVAHAKVISKPRYNPHPSVYASELYPYTINLDNVTLYINEPVVVDADLKKILDAFRILYRNENWGWFVQTTHKVSKHDFDILTRYSQSVSV